MHFFETAKRFAINFIKNNIFVINYMIYSQNLRLYDNVIL